MSVAILARDRSGREKTSRFVVDRMEQLHRLTCVMSTALDHA